MSEQPIDYFEEAAKRDPKAADAVRLVIEHITLLPGWCGADALARLLECSGGVA